MPYIIAADVDGVPPFVVIIAGPYFTKAVGVVDDYCHTIGRHAVITSGCEGVHGKGSRHPYGLAWDFRTVKPTPELGYMVGMTQAQVAALVAYATAHLPSPEWFVLLETDHLHVERKVLIP